MKFEVNTILCWILLVQWKDEKYNTVITRYGRTHTIHLIFFSIIQEEETKVNIE